MKVLAYTVCHYGKEWIAKAIESVRDYVDSHLIVYTEHPSFGYSSDLPNPDSEAELKAICDQFPHVIWHKTAGIAAENTHRQIAIDYARMNGYDIVLVVDYDEIWDSSKVKEAIDHAYNSPNGHFCVMGSQWVTFWKSLNEYVTDGFAPVRLFNLHNDFMKGEHIAKGFIYHMGYCISDELMRYKISCHGHKADFIRNNNWFGNKWLKYQKGTTRYLHPATNAYWIETKDVDFELPEILKR